MVLNFIRWVLFFLVLIIVVSLVIVDVIIICFGVIWWVICWFNCVVSFIVSSEWLLSVKKLVLVFCTLYFSNDENVVVIIVLLFVFGVCFGVCVFSLGNGKVLWFSLLLVLSGNCGSCSRIIGIICGGNVLWSCVCNVLVFNGRFDCDIR